MKGNERRNKFALLAIFIAVVCFGFDLYHFTHHLRHDPTLVQIDGVPFKIAWKAFLFVGSLVLFFLSGRKRLLGAAILMFMMSERNGLTARESCEMAREFLKESGMARDAKEDFLGRLKITPPRSSFPPEMDKVAWWGTFKPFEFWSNPEFQATWINPRGEAVNRTSFRGGHCQLAKTTLKMNQLPRGRLEPGVWRVIVNCDDVVIDNHPFAVIQTPSSPADGGKDQDSGIMIWANDLK